MPLKERFRHAPGRGVLPAPSFNHKISRFVADSSRSYAKSVGWFLHSSESAIFVSEKRHLGKISTQPGCLDNPSFQPDLATVNQHCHGNNRGLAQAYALRNLAAEEAIALHTLPAASLTERLARAKALQSLGSLWRNACERIRITRGWLLPGSLRPRPKAARPKRRALPEPLPIPSELSGPQ